MISRNRPFPLRPAPGTVFKNFRTTNAVFAQYQTRNDCWRLPSDAASVLKQPLHRKESGGMHLSPEATQQGQAEARDPAATNSGLRHHQHQAPAGAVQFQRGRFSSGASPRHDQASSASSEKVVLATGDTDFVASTNSNEERARGAQFLVSFFAGVSGALFDAV